MKSLKTKICFFFIFLFCLCLFAEPLNINNISSAVQLLHESAEAYNKDQKILSNKKLAQAKSILDIEFKKQKIFDTIILKESNNEFYIKDYLNVNEINGEYPILSFVFFTNDFIEKEDLISKKINKKDITSNEILETYELGTNNFWMNYGFIEKGSFYKCKFEIIEINTSLVFGNRGHVYINDGDNIKATYLSSTQYESRGVDEISIFDTRIRVFCRILSIKEVPIQEILNDKNFVNPKN